MATTSTTDVPSARPAFGPLALAGFASLGGGAIHAAAIGVHSEHQAAARTFAVLALLQLGWGALALVARRRSVAVVGLLISAAAVGGWVLAKTRGIGFIDGLGEVEGIQWPDFLAAALAAAAVVLTLRTFVAGARSPHPTRLALNGFGVGVVALAMLGMVQSGTHVHAEGTAGHSHGGTEAAGASAGHRHAAGAEAATTPYDPTKPIDLSGVAGVTPQQQARAENLIAITLDRLPKYADVKTAEADGFSSIHDSMTGHEHFVNWAYLDDGHVLDPDRPESLVYQVEPNGGRKLVSAMFMLAPGSTLDDVPDLGGSLTQWHIHDDLCYSATDPPRVAGITSVGGTCRPPLRKLKPVPMIHVWITKHPCGPFAALEGIGAGQVKAGETTACDHAHGA
ncbi:hypothetical protein KSP35_06555 [Aquihabitans sp. G128]|uniref:hypothetical protein n=1 Tax=Aquihabitans sp. G128 TaxID=2849779 RepID=UPI001C243518|nr:hypothetical protein [Aquihabitans sp. G128]QXC62456.1 hypothetical protein KSP35_06555 [Aquihabitans sp. G128]